MCPDHDGVVQSLVLPSDSSWVTVKGRIASELDVNQNRLAIRYNLSIDKPLPGSKTLAPKGLKSAEAYKDLVAELRAYEPKLGSRGKPMFVKVNIAHPHAISHNVDERGSVLPRAIIFELPSEVVV